MISNFICDIKKYLVSNVFYMKEIFFLVHFLHYELFLYDMKHLFKEFRFLKPVVRMLTISKLTAHVLKRVAKTHYKKHGGLHG